MDLRFYLFILPHDLQAPSANCCETLSRQQNLGALYNASPNVQGTFPEKIWGQKYAEF